MRTRRTTATVAGALVLVGALASQAAACAGLVTPGGKVRLLRTATLAGYANGVEHYVTSFTFEGGGAQFGAIVPLPGIPTKVEKGGEWTLQRLRREIEPPPSAQPGSSAGGAVPAPAAAVVVYQTRIDALDITVLKGGGREVGEWAKKRGFRLTPDTPEILEFYSRRSPIFLAARFNAEEAQKRGDQAGDGTPIHLTIPTTNPWVPLRILGTGLKPDQAINADVFLLTTRKPALLPVRAPGITLERREPASKSLLDDLRSDKGMGWVPASMWLTYVRVDSTRPNLFFDLAVDASGKGAPSWVAAGLRDPRAVTKPSASPSATASPAALQTAPPDVDTSEARGPIAIEPTSSSADRSALPIGVAAALLAVTAGGLAIAHRRSRHETD